MSAMLPQNPIFIVGYPRSGTTLLQALLATQDRIRTLPETHFFSVVLRQAGVPPGKPLDESTLERALESLREKMAFQPGPEDQEILIRDVRGGHLTGKELFEFVVSRNLPAPAPDAGVFRWLEKTPFHVLFMNEIRLEYPSVQFVHIVRDPRAAVQSRRRSFPFNAGTPVAELARQWVRCIRAADDFAHRYPERLITLAYEELAASPAEVVERVCRFLRVPFDAGRLSAYRDQVGAIILPGETWKESVREEIRDSNAARSSEIPLRDLLEVQAICRRWMHVHGYSLRHVLLQRCRDWWHGTSIDDVGPDPHGEADPAGGEVHRDRV